MATPRENADTDEDRSEHPTEEGTRRDVGASSSDREIPLPDPEAAAGRGPAGSLSDAAVETGTEEASGT